MVSFTYVLGAEPKPFELQDQAQGNHRLANVAATGGTVQPIGDMAPGVARRHSTTRAAEAAERQVIEQHLAGR